jgi:hypothetical protein
MYDFKDNQIHHPPTFKDYKAVASWEDDNNLDNLEIKNSPSTETDALRRITKQTAPVRALLHNL